MKNGMSIKDMMEKNEKESKKLFYTLGESINILKVKHTNCKKIIQELESIFFGIFRKQYKNSENVVMEFKIEYAENKKSIEELKDIIKKNEKIIASHEGVIDFILREENTKDYIIKLIKKNKENILKIS